jgi:hypothetical protein
MTQPFPQPSPESVEAPAKDPSRTGAVWVAGVGAFLIVVASAVFVASQWDQIPDAAKLGAIGLLTGAFLLAGRALEPRLPATAGSMVHLGAFLIPIDVAAVAVHLDLGWPQFLLLEGLVCSASFGLLQRVEGSILMRWAAGGSVVLLAGGISAVAVDWPVHPAASTLLVAAAAGTLLLGCDRLARGWAVVAGLAPIAALVEVLPAPDTDVVVRLGLTTDSWWGVPALTGVAAGAVLVVLAHRRRDLTDFVLGLVVAAVGVGAGWADLEPTGATVTLGPAALLVLVELTAMALRRDPFWSQPLDATAIVAEVLTGTAIATASLMLFDLEWYVDVLAEPGRIAAALALGAVGWFVADMRRQPEGAMPLRWSVLLGSGFAPAAPLVGLATATALGLVAGPGGAAVALAAFAGAVVVTARPFGPWIASVLVLAAPAVAFTGDEWVIGAAVAATGAVLASAAGVWHAAVTPRDRTPEATWVLSLVGLGAATQCGFAVSEAASPTAGLLSFVVVCWAMALILDRSERHPVLVDLGLIPRFLSMAAIGLAAGISAADTALVSAVVVTLLAADSALRDDPRGAWGLVGAVPALILSATLALELTVADAGLVLTVAAVVATGLGMLVPRRWEQQSFATAGSCVGIGLILSALDPRLFAHSLVLTGALVIGLGALVRRTEIWGAGGAVVTMGAWIELGLSGVTASDAYVAPVAILLVAVGMAARHSERVSSWVAYGPAIALLGGAGLLERIHQGSPWHALVAGGVGVAAVAVGGWRRLAAPLLIGTTLVVATAAYESLDITRGVPTWAWLAAGGAALLGAGVMMERREVGPIETGRRLVDVIHERFV